MQGESHVGFALASGITVNSFFGFMFQPSSQSLTVVFHPMGAPWNYPFIVAAIHGHTLLDVPSFIHKLSFYLMLIYCARLPDRLEKRPSGEPKPGHRGFTHSCCLVFLLIMIISTIFVVGTTWLVTRHIVVNNFFPEEFWSLAFGFLMGIVSHIIADSLTTRKVRMFWPDKDYIGIGAFSNGKPGEYIVLWGYIFLTGVLVALGIFGF